MNVEQPSRCSSNILPALVLASADEEGTIPEAILGGWDNKITSTWYVQASSKQKQYRSISLSHRVIHVRNEGGSSVFIFHLRC